MYPSILGKAKPLSYVPISMSEHGLRQGSGNVNLRSSLLGLNPSGDIVVW